MKNYIIWFIEYIYKKKKNSPFQRQPNSFLDVTQKFGNRKDKATKLMCSSLKWQINKITVITAFIDLI